MSPRVVLLDIEGTTTPIAFVHDVLFPYARARLQSFLDAHQTEQVVLDAAVKLGAEHAADEARGERPPAGAVAYLQWLMDRDRKSPALKILQGLIWEQGYQAGELHGQVFPDVPGAMRRWHAAGVRIAIYSSGSELAQRRLFESTGDGNLVPLITGFFDTAVGPKGEPASYTHIAAALGVPPVSIAFISDVTRELDAAAAAGLDVVLSVRPGNPTQPAHRYRTVTTFDGLFDAA